MIAVSGLALPPGHTQEELTRKVCAALDVTATDIHALSIARQSIDARKKSDVRYIYSVHVSVDDEARVLKRAGGVNVSRAEVREYQFPVPTRRFDAPPVVVGMGPAGLFAALSLARAGVPCIILERGKPVDERVADVERFWNTGALDPQSNVQFGEGGAGTFSDGKLTTGVHDPRVRSVFESLVALGAPNDILYSHKPHIGTDLLRGIVKNARAELIARGCEVRFGHTLTDLNIRDGRLDSVTVSTGGADYELAAPALILAPGHSARDTFSMLHRAGVPMEAKPFAVGLRIEHGQEFISRAQYGQAWTSLPPSDYKLACHLPDGRGVFTFCVCPGGVVVAAASEPGRLTTNGMSERARGGGNCNGAVLVGVSPADFPDDTPLGGIAYQIALEEAAFALGGGDFRAPAQMVGDFLRGVPSKGFVAIKPSYQPGVIPADLAQCLPPVVTNALREALPIFGRKLAGFDAPGAVLTGVESRSSSPVRLLRGADLSSPVAGLFPCGEGAGWAGGIVSAAVDGIRAAEAVAAPQA